MAIFSGSLFRYINRASGQFDEEPIRDELFSVERLEQYATLLAAEHEVFAEPRRGRRLLPRLEENGRLLLSAYRTLAETIRNKRAVSPAAEWLVDNFHIVKEQLREIRQDLPRGYYRELPKLVSGKLAGYPRVYAIALALIAHTDSRLDAETMKRFISAYQRVAPLTIGELWAVAITLRLTLVENLRRLATRIIVAREQREEADRVADRLLELAGRAPEELVAQLAAASNGRDRFDRAFIVQLITRLRDQDPEVWPAIEWLEKQLALQDSSIEQVVQQEHQRQAAAQVTVGNIITSMRLLSTLDWKLFFESVSLIDPLLGEDPAGAYALMDFQTRDRYRHEVERISKQTKRTEQETARRAVELASLAAESSPDPAGAPGARAHVGHYLIAEGVRIIEQEFGYRPRLRERIHRALVRHPTLFYLGSLAVLVSLFIAPLLYYAVISGAGAVALACYGLLFLMPVSDLAISILNLDITLMLHPRLLPKMDLEAGVPDAARTMVAIPTIFTSEETVRELLERLEVHYLANEDKHIYFALLGDFKDAPNQHMPEDEAILEAARRGIQRLNAQYSGGGSLRFHLFHRLRLYNPVEGKWMGWERKRGKLHEFNRLIGGAADTSYILSTADKDLLSGIRYVITLDSDTHLPRDAARKLIGAAQHPLNRPRLDPATSRVVEGYGILQPRVSVTLISSSRSRFARIFSGNTGIDPYTTAVSDVYQDLFGEGSYTGKGLYDVKAFEAALENRVPENLLLSHDLFEGLHARAALTTDIELLDDYPSHYDVYAKRQHRWTRGDWQIASWLFSRAPDSNGRKVRNTLPLISRWKIFDNLRRSLVAPAILLWLVAAWTVLPGSPLFWTLAVVLVLAFPAYAHVTNSLLLHPRGIPWTSHFWSIWGGAMVNTAQFALSLTFLAHQAYLQLDAIARTFYRRFVSRKLLLEWTTASEAQRASVHDVAAFWRFMWPAAAISIAAGAITLLARPDAILIAAPFLLVWMASPVVAYWVSRPLPDQQERLEPDEHVSARLIARRTWKFFETFVGEQDNWLAPDNYQEEPKPVLAHRTSPTNIGLLQLSTAAAYDFGYLGVVELAERLERTFTTIGKLERFHGHFLNWYDTKTLAPLTPRYVSTVDSGNLAGHLLALKQSCVEIVENPLFAARVIEGFGDAVSLIREEARRLAPVRQSTRAVTLENLREEIEACARIVASGRPETLTAWADLFALLTRHAVEAEDIVDALSQEHGAESFEQIRLWITSLIEQLRQQRRDLVTLTPWASALASHVEATISGCSKEARDEWRAVTDSLQGVPALSDLSDRIGDALIRLDALAGKIERGDSQPKSDRDKALKSLRMLRAAIEEAAEDSAALLTRYSQLARTSDDIMRAMDFRFLFDEERKVFVIGYNVTDGRRDNSYYDLLASEARLASFIAIAKGDVPQEHWFRLGRQLTSANGSRALVSWTATMFEYLMPLLVMRGYSGTLLDQTHHAAVERQIEYGRERGVPWGVSEAAYNARDRELNYQYGPFGVPGLGLKRGLSEDLVISPYSSALAAMVEPQPALENLQRLAGEGALTRYGFYESIDYTKERLPKNQKKAIIRAFMVHHQGMSLVALDNVINRSIMQGRFHADPLVQATELLLQERIPQNVEIANLQDEELYMDRVVQSALPPMTRSYDSPDLPTPRTQLLSNGTYTVMVTTAGSGYSRSGRLAVTRWREDATRDNWGSFCYLRDVRSGGVWSAGYQPVERRPQSYEVSLAEDKAEFRRKDEGIATLTEIIVSPEDNAEVRRVSVTNNSTRLRTIELTSYAEVVLAPPASDAAHPAFSNLFIQTEFIAAENALLATRRRRSQTEEEAWALHTVVTEGEAIGAVQYETDRARFVGRGHTTADPVAVTEGRPLSNTVGAVLDPVFSLRQRVRLQPGETVRVSFTTGTARSRDEALALADKYHNPYAFAREAELAWTKSQVEMRHLGINADEAHLFQRLAGRALYSDPSLRPRPHVLALNSQAQSSLWKYGISGDLPLVIARIGEAKDLNIVRRLLRGHEYLRLKGLAIDLLILNDHPPSYAQTLQEEIQMLIRASGSQALIDKPGGVFLRRTDIMSEEDRILLHTVARVVIVTDRGPLEEQLVRRPDEDELPPPFIPRAPSRPYPQSAIAHPDLTFFNGLGGFAGGGRQYVTLLGEGQWTPAPWLNVISNSKDFGFQVSETGAGYTWSANSRENRLTPWSNDWVSDPVGEAVYLRDEETGEIWSPTPLPIRGAEDYVIKHGQGYTSFDHVSHGLLQELLMFAPLDASVKVSLLRLHNQTERRRRLSVTSYAEWVLGFQRGQSAPYIITEIDEQTGAIFARNPYNNEFAHRVAFADMSERYRSFTCDRKEFLGRNGSPARPAALRRAMLSGSVGAGLDPCAAMQAIIELAPGEAREIILLIGEAETVEEARATASRFKQVPLAKKAFEGVIDYWDDLLEAVKVTTPDTAMDTMLNQWLQYQTLACRVWARSAFYQSGGAYGFRDQLQDVSALVYCKPEITREQIVRCAGRQFKEGDVQHWWHPPTGRGVRTRFSDDLLWMPFVTSFYISVTGDRTVLDEVVPFLEAPLLEEGQDEAYTQPEVSSESASVYEHCARALDRSLAVGAHGLPLMGSGDWNDGMNRVGNQGKGESVWVGWFLYKTLGEFAPFCDARGEPERARRYREHMTNLKQALEENGWDGDWYRRAYFDDGTPLGSAENEECRIDSIVQSWGVISGAAEPSRARRAMGAVEEYLIRRGDGLVILFTPPFDKSALDPGYIKGYVPGVRENGGQYTHAALWTLIAYAELGDGDRAGELFALLNPISHASTRAGLHKYKVEPYVAAGDVYAVWPHTGRGGWSWYTGSAGWMYRAGLESILGFRLQGDRLTIDPCIPRSWREYEIAYKRGATRYTITVENPYGFSRGVAEVELDGTALPASEITLSDDGGQHIVRVVLGERQNQPAG